MFKVKSYVCLAVLTGIFAAPLSYATQRRMPYDGLIGSTWNTGITFGTRNSAANRAPLELSLSVTPRTASLSHYDLLHQEAFYQAFMQKQLQHCMSEYNIARGHTVEGEMMQYQMTSKALSAVELKASINSLTNELYGLRNQRYALLNERRDLGSRIELPHETILLALGKQTLPLELELAYLKNEKNIADMQYAIEFRECLVACNQADLKRFTVELQTAQTNFKTKTLTTTAYSFLEQEIPKLQACISENTKQYNAAITELPKVRTKLAAVQGEIEPLDHWYVWGWGDEFTALKEQEKVLGARIEELGKIIPASHTAMQEAKRELNRIQPLVAYGKQCVVDSMRLQKTDMAGIEAKQRVAAANDTVVNKGQHTVIVIELSREGQELLKCFGIDAAQFKSFSGNAIQKQLSNELCGIINRTGKTLIDFKGVVKVRAYVEATARTCEVANDVIRNGTPCQAMSWTNMAYVCEKATEVVKGAARGAIKGVVGTYEFIAHAVVHPQQFADQCRATLRLWIGIDENGQIIKDRNWLEKIENAYNQFSHLSLGEQTEHVVEMLAAIMVPLPKVDMLTNFYKSFARLDKVVKAEAAVLCNSPKIEQAAKFAETPLSSGLTEAIHATMKELTGVVPKEKVAEMAAAALTKSTQIGKTAKTTESASLLAQAVKSEKKLIVVTAATQQPARTSTTVAKETIKAVAQATEKVSKEELALAKAGSQAKPATHVASTAVEAEVKVSAAARGSASQTAVKITKERKVMPEEAVRSMQPKSGRILTEVEAAQATAKVSKEEAAIAKATSLQVTPATRASTFTEAEAKTAAAVAERVPEGFKVVIDKNGKRNCFPLEYPMNKSYYHHVYRPWKKRGIIKGAHMAEQRQPEIISKVTATDAFGVKQVDLKMEGAKSLDKTIVPASWNLVDYANHVQEAYHDSNLIVEPVRPGVFKFTGTDKSGITWEMFMELDNGIYKATTAYPKLCIKT